MEEQRMTRCPKCGGKVLEAALERHLKMMCPAKDMPDGSFNCVRGFSRSYKTLKLVSDRQVTFEAEHARVECAAKPLGSLLQLMLHLDGRFGSFSVRDVCTLAQDDTFIFERRDGILYARCGDVLKQLNESEYISDRSVANALSSITVPAKGLAEAIESVVISVATDESRPVLTAVCWDIHDGVLHLVGADGFRLTQSDGMPVKSDGDRQFLVPARACVVLAKLLGADDVSVLFGASGDETRNRISFISGASILTTDQIQGTFPQYTKLLAEALSGKGTGVIPDDEKGSGPVELVIRPKELLATINSIVSPEEIRLAKSECPIAVRIVVNGGMATMSYLRSEEGYGSHCPLPVVSAKGDGYIAFNPRYLSDVARQADDTMTLHWTTWRHGAGITSGQTSHILMPMYVRWKEMEANGDAGKSTSANPGEHVEDSDVRVGGGEQAAGESSEGSGTVGGVHDESGNVPDARGQDVPVPAING